MIAAYQNGNVSVTLYEDGTKVREFDGIPMPEYPESIDVKITDYCDANCSFCHEMSTVNGTHGDLELGISVLSDMPSGTEIAIGGGNPLSHTGLIPFLEQLRSKNIVPNLTVNQLHLKKYQDLIKYLLSEQLIFGLGISYYRSDSQYLDMFMTPNTVLHMIIGVHSHKELEKVHARWPNAKVLLLGYKTFGRGKEYYDKTNNYVQQTMYGWYTQLPKFFNSGLTLSFDNLGIEQLNMRRFFTDDSWSEFYMGDDGTFTMYMDLVKRQYAPTSTSKERFDLGTMSIKEIFAHVRSMK